MQESNRQPANIILKCTARSLGAGFKWTRPSRQTSGQLVPADAAPGGAIKFRPFMERSRDAPDYAGHQMALGVRVFMMRPPTKSPTMRRAKVARVRSGYGPRQIRTPSRHVRDRFADDDADGFALALEAFNGAFRSARRSVPT